MKLLVLWQKLVDMHAAAKESLILCGFSSWLDSLMSVKIQTSSLV